MPRPSAKATHGKGADATADHVAAEQAVVDAWVEEAVQSRLYDVPLKDLPSGRVLLAGDPRQSCRYVVAAVEQTQRWNRVIAAGRDDPGTAHDAYLRRWHANAVARALLRRTLPFTASDLVTILTAFARPANDHAIEHPIGALVRALERHVAKAAAEEPLLAAMRQYAACLRERFAPEGRPHAVAVERLCAIGTEDAAAQPDVAVHPAARPAPAGTPTVFTSLKKQLGMLPGDHALQATAVEPDGFPLCDASPLRQAHELIGTLLRDVSTRGGEPVRDIGSHEAGQRLLALDPPGRGRAALAAAERALHARSLPGGAGWAIHVTAGFAMQHLLAHAWELDRAGHIDFMLSLAITIADRRGPMADVRDRLAAAVLRDLAAEPPTAGERFVLSLFRRSRIAAAPLGNPADEIVALTRAIGDGAQFFLIPGEVWTDAVNEDVGRLPAGERPAWVALLAHALQASASRPSAAWLETATGLIDAIGTDWVHEAFARWLPLVSRGRSTPRRPSFAGSTRPANG